MPPKMKRIVQFPKDRHKRHPLPMKNSSHKEKQARVQDQDYIHQHHPQELIKKNNTYLVLSEKEGVIMTAWLNTNHRLNTKIIAS
ncbi:hypothetical protein DPMN_034324 [Dreissena polymorpha]|uniref:Uncharacterized protein n=1 Tax=Dreissena polymorpha TaxID=45954 RepID=A0A9D4M5G6_DREPO|nr:hypothetical protein DPMN_034324 [Dreissena polymorpha]